MEEQYQEPPLNYAFPMQNREESDRNIRWKVDPEDVIEEIAHYLRGDKWDSEAQSWTKNIDKEQMLCNTLGISTFTTYLRSFLNKNIILSNFKDDIIINKIALENVITIINLIYTSYDTFEIKKQNMSIVKSIVDNNVYASLLRAKDGFFVHHLSTTQRFIESSNVTTQEREKKRRTFSNPFANWGGNKDGI